VVLPKKSVSGFFGPIQEGNWFSSRSTCVVDDGYEYLALGMKRMKRIPMKILNRFIDKIPLS